MTTRVNRRTFLAGTGAVGAGLAFGACGSDDDAGQQPQDSAAGSAEPASGDLTVWNFASQMNDVIENDFAQAHPDIDLDYVNLPVPDLHERLLVSLATETDLPDATTISSRQVGEYVKSGRLLDLTSAMQPFVDGLDPAAFVSDGERIVGVNLAGGHMGLWVNHDALVAAGIDPDTFTTWDAVVDAGLKLKQDAGDQQYLFLLPDGSNGFNSFNAYYHSRGGNWWNAEAELVEDQQIAVDTLSWLVTQVRDNEIVYRGMWTDPTFWEAVNNESMLGFGMNFAVGANNIPDNAPDQSGQWRLVTWPRWSEGAEQLTGQFGGVVFTGIQGQNEAAAREFVTWWLTDEGLQLVSDIVGTSPSTRIAELGLLDTEYPYFGGQQLGRDMSSVPFPPFHYHHWARTEEVLINAMDRALLGEWTPEQAIDNALDELRSV